MLLHVWSLLMDELTEMMCICGLLLFLFLFLLLLLFCSLV